MPIFVVRAIVAGKTRFKSINESIIIINKGHQDYHADDNDDVVDDDYVMKKNNQN